MKKIAMLLMMSAISCLLTACSENYVMHTQDGRTIVADGKPVVDNDTGMISYKDANGKQQQINKTDIKDMSASGQ
ncbi:YgdI/YgdR family lipoprotein [Enterobacteriaceae bacterium LUAb1]